MRHVSASLDTQEIDDVIFNSLSSVMLKGIPVPKIIVLWWLVNGIEDDRLNVPLQ